MIPAAPRDIIAELYVNDTWTDISEDVYQRDPITITRGRRSDQSQPTGSTCSLTLNNRAGKYSPRNPMGAYYGSIGRNTPIRVGIRYVRDQFATRTSASGWSTADVTGQAWSAFGSGGVVSGTDTSVSGGKGVHLVPAANAYRFTYLAFQAYRDIEVAVTVTLSFTNITGAPVEPACLMFRGTSTSSYRYVKVAIQTDESIQLSFLHANGTSLAAPVTISGLTHSSAQALRVRAQVEGQTMRAKVWAATGNEPAGWHLTAHLFGTVTAGWVGVRSGLASGNTNAPVTFTYDDFEVKTPRFAGYLTDLPNKWDTSGNDAYVPVEASGLLRRLGTGSAPLQSAIRRGVLRLATAPVAYWPCEDGSDATEISSGIGGPAMTFTGTPSFSANDDFVASSRLPTFSQSEWGGAVPTYTDVNGQLQVRFLLSIGSSGDTAADGYTVCRVHTSGTAAIWDLTYNSGAGGTLTLNIYDSSQVLLATTGAYVVTLNGNPSRISLELDQVGANIDWRLGVYNLGGSAYSSTGTLAGRDFDLCTGILLGVNHGFTSTTVGHVTVQAEITADDIAFELEGWDGETAGERFVRLCGEEGVSAAYIANDIAASALMGPQGVATLLTLLHECAAADMGELYESRGTAGLVYRARDSLYAQTAQVELDYSANQLMPPWEPVDDDELLRNDITVSRTDGGQARQILEAGALSVLEPEDGGVGRYDTSYTLNVAADSQLLDAAGWLLLLGTWDEARYPSVGVNLASHEVVADTGLTYTVLDAEAGDRLTVVNASAANAYDDISNLVRGYTETLLPSVHSIRFACVAEGPYQVLVLDDGDVHLDLEGVTLNEDLDTTETGVDVAIASGYPLLTTSAGDMPIAIVVGGEEMSVTAVSGAASPQTLTVTRSVNGVVKTHSIGAEVRLARRATLAL